MRILLRFALPLVAILASMAAVLTPVADRLIERWFQSDVELRSRLIFNSVRGALDIMVGNSSVSEMESLFNRIAEDERVAAVGWCGAAGRVDVASRAWPQDVICPASRPDGSAIFQIEGVDTRRLLIAAFALGEPGPGRGRLVILHDMGFAATRSLTARLYLMGFLTLFSFVAAGVTLLVAQWTQRAWIRSLHQSLRGIDSGAGPGGDPKIAPVIAKIRELLRDLDSSRGTTAGIRIDWSADTLHRVLDTEMPGVEIIVVSNREPYIHNRLPDGTVRIQKPASGLVTALEPIMRACRGVWVAHGSGSADRETVDGNDRVRVPPENPDYTLRRVWLSDEEQDGYYYGLSNEGMWPLCHITFVRPVFREEDWQHYASVNRKFADAVVAEAKRPDPIILVQDYHLALVPRMVREKLPHAAIVTFWHIPWPNPEVFGICPWREQILDGLLGSSIIGFHTQLHCNNFVETADRFMECHIDREQTMVSIGGHSTLVRPYPISIAWPPAPLEKQAPVPACRTAVLGRYGLPGDTLLGVGVERFDFTKGIPDRFRAVEILLDRHPEWIGRFVFLQVAAPTRTKLAAYRDIQAESEAVATQVNARFGRDGYKPIILVVEHHEPDQVYEIFRAGNLCIVSSLHDGMNLVAKEFVAARDDEHGVLILSAFAGASRELMEALIVNPFDARATAETIDTALRMPAEQQTERMHLMRQAVSESNVFYWAGRMLLDVARIRKRAHIESNIAQASRKDGRSA